MKMLFGFFVILASVSTSAQALMINPFPESEVSEIVGADLLCTSVGGMFAINSTDKRVWQGEPGENVGLELLVKSFLVLRCGPSCYDIQASLTFDEDTVSYRIVTSHDPLTQKVSAHVTIQGDHGEGGETLSFDCSKPE